MHQGKPAALGEQPVRGDQLAFVGGQIGGVDDAQNQGVGRAFQPPQHQVKLINLGVVLLLLPAVDHGLAHVHAVRAEALAQALLSKPLLFAPFRETRAESEPHANSIRTSLLMANDWYD